MNRLYWKRFFETEEGMQALEVVMVLAIAAVAAAGVVMVGKRVQKWGKAIISLALKS